MELGSGTTHTIASSFAALNLQSSNQPSAFFREPYQSRTGSRV